MDQLLTGIWRWESQDEEGVAMVSYAFEDPEDGTLVVDPAWDADAVAQLERMTRPLRLIVSTGNHIRDARRYRSRLAVPIWASAVTARDMEDANRVLEPGEELPGGWQVVAAPGVYEGEIALYRPQTATTPAILYVGDVVVGVAASDIRAQGAQLGRDGSAGMDHAGPTSHLAFLPERLVADPARLRDTVFALSRRTVDVLLMGHGRPVLTDAGAELGQLLRR